MQYIDELIRSMNYLSDNKDTIFLGQGLKTDVSYMFQTFRDVPQNKKIELPVVEELQMGMTIGLALDGKIPITIYPRWDFLILASNQLINHLDKINKFNYNFDYRIKTIIRVGVGSNRPLNPQCQHTGDYTNAFRNMLETVDVIQLIEPRQIFDSYQRALERDDNKSTMLVEYGYYYKTK